jgi:hypothetical protein
VVWCNPFKNDRRGGKSAAGRVRRLKPSIVPIRSDGRVRGALAGDVLIALACVAQLKHCPLSVTLRLLGTVPVVGQKSHVTLVLGKNLNENTKAPASGSCLREGGLGVFSLAVLGPGGRGGQLGDQSSSLTARCEGIPFKLVPQRSPRASILTANLTAMALNTGGRRHTRWTVSSWKSVHFTTP